MENIFEKLNLNTKLNVEESFILARHVMQKINGTSHEMSDGRRILITVIDKWACIPEKRIWIDIIEAVGFYPYLASMRLLVEDFSSQVRVEYHKSNYLNGKILHKEQKELSKILLSKKNVIVSAPTSFGKSLLIEEIVASNIYRNIVIIQPTLALLDETRIKLRKYENKYKIIVRTLQQPSDVLGNIFLLTAERVLEYKEMPKIELLVLDEFYKLSSNRDDDRSIILNNAFLKLYQTYNCKFYLLGPNIDGIPQGFIEKYDAEFIKTKYELVYTKTVNKINDVQINQYDKVEPNDLFQILSSLEEQTLVFCASPNTARNLAFAYADFLFGKKDGQNNVALIEWIESNIGRDWSLSNCLKHRIGVHDGALPKHMTNSIIYYFNRKDLDVLFCTNTIIEGVNTSAKNVVYYDNKIGERPVDFFDYSNIKGRAGRLMEHATGRIINLREPPLRQEMNVDIPFFDQNPIELEVLVNVVENDVKDIADNKERYEEFHKKEKKLQELLKKNGVSIPAQLAMLARIEQRIYSDEGFANLVWTGIPKYLFPKFEEIFNLCYENLASDSDKAFILSAKRLAMLTKNYCLNKNIYPLIDDEVKYQLSQKLKQRRLKDITEDEYKVIYKYDYQQLINKSIENQFKLLRNWFQYKVPKWLNVVDALVKFILDKVGIQTGDYSVIADMIENDFCAYNCRMLIEYGIPSTVAKKIEASVRQYGEEDVIKALRANRKTVDSRLSAYEIETLNRSL